MTTYRQAKFRGLKELLILLCLAAACSGGNLSNSQESLASKFDKYIGQATTANEALHNVKTVCKYPSKFASWFTGKGGDCFGYDIPNLDPNKILKKKLGKKDVQDALRGVIQLIDPQEDVSKLEVKARGSRDSKLQKVYDAHNEERRRNGVADIQVDKELEKMIQREGCRSHHSTVSGHFRRCERLRRGKLGRIAGGENIGSVEGWIDEKRYLVNGQCPLSRWKKCGHYHNAFLGFSYVVDTYIRSRKVGCAVKNERNCKKTMCIYCKW